MFNYYINKVTPFGKVLRTLRINNNELLKDMADFLEITPSYLSQVELGKRNIPDSWIKKISDKYKLDEYRKNDLISKQFISQSNLKINLNKLEIDDRCKIYEILKKYE